MKFVKPSEYFDNWAGLLEAIWDGVIGDEYPIWFKLFLLFILFPSLASGALIGLQPESEPDDEDY